MLLLLLLILELSDSLTFNITTENNEISTLCAKNIYFNSHEYFDRNLLIVQTNKSIFLDLKWVKSSMVLNLNEKIQIYHKFEMFSYYIFIINSSNEYKYFINITYYTSLWNPRAKVLIIFTGIEDDIEYIFEISWKYYALRIIVLHKNKMYTYDPFNKGNCNDTSKILLEKNCTGVNFPKIPKFSNGCQMDIAPFFNPPYIKNPSLHGDNIVKVGLEAVILNNLLKSCNLTRNYVNNSFPLWGYKFPDGNSTLLYNLLFNRKCHGIAGQININESFYFDFDSTIFYIYEYSTWFVPIANAQLSWQSLILVFNNALWIALIGVFIILVVIWWLVSNEVQQNNDFRQFSVCLTKLWYILLQGSVTNPQSKPLKILYIFWVYVTLLIAAAYQSKLISVLTNPTPEHQITNVEEMVKAKLPFGSIPSARNFFRNTDSKEDKLVYDNFVNCPDAIACIDLVFQGKFGFMMPQILMSYRVPFYMKRNDTKNNVYGFKKVVKPIMYNMYTLRGYPFLERFNDVILRLQANGLIWKWTEETKKIINIIKKSEDENANAALTLTNLYSSFFVLLFGYIFAVIFFCLEVFYYFMKKRFSGSYFCRYNISNR